jgi:NADPH:quinone reductase-like Zn-dependent oxidoreductase
VLAIGCAEFGGPDVLQIVELPTPTLGERQVRIRVHAATVNPVDTGFRAGFQRDRMKGHEPPFIPGMDAAGVIEAIGPQAGSRLRVGQRVMALMVPRSSTKGAYAEQVVVSEDSAVEIPDGFSFAEAAAVLMNATTARLCLDAARLAPGDAVLVTGAAGALGGHVLEIARAERLRVIADASPADRALVTTLGANVVLNRGDGLARAAREYEPAGVPAVIDAAVLNDAVLPAIRDGGSMIVVRGWDGSPPPRGISVEEVWVSGSVADVTLLTKVAHYLEAGVVKPRIAEIMAASRVADAHRRLEAGGLRGRLILDLTAF